MRSGQILRAWAMELHVRIRGASGAQHPLLLSQGQRFNRDPRHRKLTAWAQLSLTVTINCQGCKMGEGGGILSHARLHTAMRDAIQLVHAVRQGTIFWYLIKDLVLVTPSNSAGELEQDQPDDMHRRHLRGQCASAVPHIAPANSCRLPSTRLGNLISGGKEGLRARMSVVLSCRLHTRTCKRAPLVGPY